MSMFGMTTFMFALGIIALVMGTPLGGQWVKAVLSGKEPGPAFFNTSAVLATIMHLTVRSNDAIVLSV